MVPLALAESMNVTDEVYLDEVCLGLWEMVLPPKDGRSLYRIRLIQVWRNGVKTFADSLGSSREMIMARPVSVRGAWVNKQGRIHAQEPGTGWTGWSR